MDMARRVGCVGMLLSVVLSIGAQAALAQDKITNDPFVREQIRREHWEPGGRYWPSNFQNRGSVIPSSRSGVVTPIMVSSQRVGNLLIQTAQISGQYNYTIDLSSHHPHSVHSPFDRTASASDSATEESQTKSVTVNLAWTSLYNHPANGYDAPQGGGYPTPDPRGAVDHFTHTITGSAVGQYIMTSSDWQRFDPPPAHTILTNAMVTDSSNPFLNVVGSPGDNASSSKDSLTNLSLSNLANPNEARSQGRGWQTELYSGGARGTTWSPTRDETGSYYRGQHRTQTHSEATIVGITRQNSLMESAVLGGEAANLQGKLGHFEYGGAVKTDLKDWKKGEVNLGAEIGAEFDAARLDGKVQIGDPEALSARATGTVKVGSVAGKALGNISFGKQGFKAEGELKGEAMVAKAEGDAALAWMVPKWMPWIGGTAFEGGVQAHAGFGVEGKLGGKAEFGSSGFQLKGGAAAALGVGGGADFFFNVKFPTGDEVVLWIHIEQDADGKMRMTQSSVLYSFAA